MQKKYAPGAPGVKAKWISGSKSGVGKALGANSFVGFTLSHGILNEVFYPREDVACIRDMQFIITDGKNFFSEEKRDTHHAIKTIKPGVPFYRVINTCVDGKYELTKEILCDSFRNTLLQKISFKNLSELPLQLFALTAPHLNNKGDNNTGWIGEYKGVEMLFAEAKELSLAIACSSNWLKRSAGYVGVSDGWTQLHQYKKLLHEYTQADEGHIALTAEIDISTTQEFIIAIGFGKNAAEAASQARGSLLEGFKSARKIYVKGWNQWLNNLHDLKGKLYKQSAAVLRLHEAKNFPGGIIASFSIPWGQVKGDEEKGGYHVVWPRDLVEAAGGMLALKAYDDALRILNYLMSMQQANGSWPQNMWLEGTPNWNSIQMDQTALPILLIDKCKAFKIIDDERMQQYWPLVKKAVEFIIQNGPYTKQDRWEEEKGFTPFTLATQIAALLAAADLADEFSENEMANYCRQTADYWNDNVEKWMYVTNTSLANKYDVDGYYIRINPYNDIAADDLNDNIIDLHNHKNGEGKILLNELICVDVLALVRFGLRAANDPKILNTLKIIDAELKVTTPGGDCWHRYNNDGYGEDENGNPYDKTGVGRAWPLLTGERAHYEIAAGNFSEAKKLVKAMEAFSNNGFLPEQIWDADDIPEKELFFGKPSGSAMPLTWTHAEYIKLCCSVKDKKIFDMPRQTQQRYIKQKITSPFEVWRFESKCKTISSNKTVRIEVFASAVIEWTIDDWQTINKTETKDSALKIFYADIDVKHLQHQQITFTFFWKEANRYEGENFVINVT